MDKKDNGDAPKSIKKKREEDFLEFVNPGVKNAFVTEGLSEREMKKLRLRVSMLQACLYVHVCVVCVYVCLCLCTFV